MMRRDPRSILTLYRRLLALRRETRALAVGTYAPVNHQDDVLVYLRTAASQRCLIALNLGTEARAFDSGRVADGGRIALSTHLDRSGETVRGAISLRGDEGIVVSCG